LDGRKGAVVIIQKASPEGVAIMKSTLALSMFALSLLMLGGCSSMQDKSAMAKPHDVDDANYVATVEQYDRRHGISVTWVNPPQKRVPEQTNTGNDSD
jgi:hypothetical protein